VSTRYIILVFRQIASHRARDHLKRTHATGRHRVEADDWQQPVAAQPVDGAAQQRQRPIIAERPVAQPRPQRVEIAVAAPANDSDGDREAAVNVAVRRDLLELVVGDGEERGQ